MTKFVSSLILKTIDRKKLKKQKDTFLAGMTYKKDVQILEIHCQLKFII